ncbi:MAG: molecular chaperone HtpG, partial [Lachnospiraceae bacterium]|nr:molecular chaperone HtpG [Lachnospiraceae bacterium]
DPLFWIHLNMDYPFNLKGILYFPMVNIEYETIEGKIKLYSNQVFIADNIKEVIPEFLLLLKGVIDCPDLPLNVSRSALQNDGFVKKISDYITKKVADKLTGMFNVERENYEKYWDDIAPFIKFGCLKDDKFYDKMKNAFIYKNLDGKYLTLDEYIKARKDGKEEPEDKEKTGDSKAGQEADDSANGEKNEGSAEDGKDKKKDPEIVYYVTDEKQQSQYINMFRDEGIDAVVLNTNIDNPFISLIESKNEEVRFQRIDADITGSFKEEADEESLKKDTEKLAEIFKKVLGKEKLEVKAERLKNEKISSVITLAEDSRRMSDMMKMYSMNMPGGGDDLFAEQETLTLNVGNNLVKYILEHGEDETSELICRQLYDLAMLAHKPLAPEEMTKFVERSNEIMLMLTK